jgi:hypothetical protein
MREMRAAFSRIALLCGVSALALASGMERSPDELTSFGLLRDLRRAGAL